MKTKFTDIVKIRKRKVDELQDYLARIEFNIQSATMQIDVLVGQLYAEKTPTEGSISELLQLQEIKRAYKVEIENKRANLSNLLQTKQTAVEMLKEANIEYEKMKHLHELELKKYADILKQKEAKNLDEIAVMLFNNRV